MARRLLVVILPLVSGPILPAAADDESPDSASTRHIEIPYLTTREYELLDDGSVSYSTEVGEVSAGRCELTLSDGESLEVSNGPIAVEPVETVYSRLAGRDDGDLLVYVHGYNIGLERACRDAARVAYLAGVEGRLLLFSWPASRAAVTYRRDEQRLAQSMPAILGVLDDLGARFGYDRIDILAHSMGSRIVMSVIDTTRPEGRRFDDLVLVAPDIDLEAFVETVPELQRQARSISILVAASDRLLALSQFVNGGERLGQADDLSAEGVEVFDVSEFEDLGFSRHMYHLDNRRIGELLGQILETDAEP